MSYTPSLDLLASQPPCEMEDWAKNKIFKMTFLKSNNLWYSENGSEVSLICTAVNMVFRSFYHNLHQKLDLSFDKEIVVLTQVLNDGLGDYYNCFAAAKAIKEAFPKQKICMISVFNSTEQLDKISPPRKMDHYLCKPYESCSQEAIERIRNASFVLELPIKVDESFSKDLATARDKMRIKSKYTYITENGSRAHGMGLDYQDKGIFIKKMPSNRSLVSLKSDELKICIFGKNSISEDDVKEYFQDHELFFSYIHSHKKNMRMFLYTALYSQENQNKTIDIISHLTPSDLNFYLVYLKGVATVEFIFKDPSLNVVKEIAKEGKLLRILNPFPLSQKDSQLLMINSHSLTGCTGDQSFSEAISFNKLPFYEIRTHKTSFFSHYLNLAKHEFKNELLLKYLNMIKINEEISNFCEKEIAEQAMMIANIITNPVLFEEVQQFNKIIQKNFSFNETLKEIVAQKIVQEKFPSFIRLEQKINDLIFCKQKISSLQEIWDRLNRKAKKLQGV